MNFKLFLCFPVAQQLSCQQHEELLFAHVGLIRKDLNGKFKERRRPAREEHVLNNVEIIRKLYTFETSQKPPRYCKEHHLSDVELTMKLYEEERKCKSLIFLVPINNNNITLYFGWPRTFILRAFIPHFCMHLLFRYK